MFESGRAPAASASGVPLAMFAPSISADDAPHSRLLRRGVHVLLDELQRLTAAGLLKDGEDWAMTGALERCIRTDKKLPVTWLEPQDPPALQSRVLANPSAEGVTELFHGAAGWVNPSRLVAAWLAHCAITVHTQTHIASLDDVRLPAADRVVVACGYQTPHLEPSVATRLQPIRGQVEWGHASATSRPINGMGHWIEGAGRWLAGATFQRGESDVAVRRKDVDLNFEKLSMLRPELDKSLINGLRAQSQSWVGVRITQKNRAPLVARIASLQHPQVWICTGLGARGLSLAALCARQLLHLCDF